MDCPSRSGTARTPHRTTHASGGAPDAVPTRQDLHAVRVRDDGNTDGTGFRRGAAAERLQKKDSARVPGYRDHAVSLTKDGRSLLESHRDVERDHHQTFYAGLGRERELEHDLQVYRACEQAEAHLLERGAQIERVVLDHELKSEYQRWLHERDKDYDDYDGHPDRTPDEIREWAHEHDLPYFDDEVHFPDVRLEYQEPDGRWEREDIARLGSACQFRARCEGGCVSDRLLIR